MKKTLILLSIILLSIHGFSQENVEIDNLEKKDNVYYYKNEPFTGNCYGKHPNGKIGLKGQVVEGKKEGVWIWWYSDGQKKRETTFESNKKEGLTTYWYINGVKSKEIMYKEDKNIDQKLWDEKGNRLPNPTFSQY